MRGRRLSALISAGLLAIAVAGCGGGDEIAPEVPGGPADVTLPSGTVEPTSTTDEDTGTTDEDTGSTDDSTTDDGTGTTDDGTTTPPADETGATTPDTSGGTTAPEAEADSPTNDTPPPDGSDAEQFEDFCEQNEGAC
jgi:hypothetical protein